MPFGKLNEYTLRQCNKCPSSPVDEALNVMPSLFKGFLLDIEPHGRFPLKMLPLRGGSEVAVCDDALSLSLLRSCAALTVAIIPHLLCRTLFSSCGLRAH